MSHSWRMARLTALKHGKNYDDNQQFNWTCKGLKTVPHFILTHNRR